MNIRISAVIPTYNRESTIHRAILSAIEQLYPPTEIIVVDDGSTDNTRVLVNYFGDKVKYIYQENRGVSAARNTGVAAATDDWVAFLDSDDYWLPHHLDNISKAVEDTKGLAACYFADVVFSPKKDYCSWWNLCQFVIDQPYVLNMNGEWALLKTHPILLQASVIKRSAFLECGGLLPHMKTREDTLLFYKLAFQYPVCAVKGFGTSMTDDAEQRLTCVYDSNHEVYRNATILMYKDILSSAKLLEKRHRRIMENKLCDAYTSMAFFNLRKMELRMATKNFLAAAQLRPSRILIAICEKLKIKI